MLYPNYIYPYMYLYFFCPKAVKQSNLSNQQMIIEK
nr:MAG TPA: hypothetical protein [Caudoviricetes sp.]